MPIFHALGDVELDLIGRSARAVCATQDLAGSCHLDALVLIGESSRLRRELGEISPLFPFSSLAPFFGNEKKILP